MTLTVLDAHALMVYFQKEPSYGTVRDLLAEARSANTRLLVASVNLGEVFYKTLKKWGQGRLREVELLIPRLPLEIIDADMALVREAALIKATRKMSYADCFAAALAKMRGGRVVTGDPEFHEVEGDIKILWI